MYIIIFSILDRSDILFICLINVCINVAIVTMDSYDDIHMMIDERLCYVNVIFC